MKVGLPINLDDVPKIPPTVFVVTVNLQTTSLPTALKIPATDVIIKDTLLYIANCKPLKEKLARIVKALNIFINSALKMLAINIIP